MERKIVKRPKNKSSLASESVPVLKEEIVRLKDEIRKLNNKILAQETTIITVKNKKAKTDERLIKLQAENERLKKGIDLNPHIMATVVAALKKSKHDEPPPKHE